MKEKTFYIYKITNKINNKIYIGKSINPTKRFRAHINLAINYAGKYECTKLYRSIRKYGKEQFYIEIIDSFDKEKDSYMAEATYVEQYDCIATGMNTKPGGRGGSAGGINHPMWGKKFSAESKLKMSKSHQGTKDTLETKKKKSLSHSGEKSHYAKLSYKDVEYIKRELNGGIPVKDLAIQFNVSLTSIYNIRSGSTWK